MNFRLILSHMVCQKFNYHVYKLKSRLMGEWNCSYFAMGFTKVLPLGGIPCSETIAHGPINMAPLMEAPLWTPIAKRKQLYFPIACLSIFIHDSWTSGKPYGIKLRCCWKHFREQLGNSRNLKGTWWNHVGNNRKKPKIILPHSTPKMKKQGPSLMHVEPPR